VYKKGINLLLKAIGEIQRRGAGGDSGLFSPDPFIPGRRGAISASSKSTASFRRCGV